MLGKLGMIFLCTSLISSIYAREISESVPFIGAELGIAKVQGSQPSDTSNDQSYGLRVGAQNEQWRTTITLNYFDSNKHNVEKLFLSVDYFFLKSDTIGDYPLYPYFGTNLGYANFESTGGADANGLLYGAQAGIILNITEDIGFDIGYRYSLSASDELDHTSDVIFSLNYQY